MKNQFSTAILLVVVLLISGCTEAKVEKPVSVLRPNTVTTVKANGEYFTSQINKIDNQIVMWTSRWEDQIVARQKMFQNIFPVAVSQEGSSYYNEFEKDQLEPLFPLTIGKEVAFDGVQYHSKNEEGVPFWAIISVVGSGAIVVKDQKHDVVIINIIMETEVEGVVNRDITTLWHAKELGLNLRVKQKRLGGASSSAVKFEVVDIYFPDRSPEDIKNVGTTRINYQDNKGEISNLVVLNEAKL